MHVLVFGDSISQGFFDTTNNGWASLLFKDMQQRTLDSNFDIYHNLFNQSISGENTTEILARFKTESGPRLSSSKKNIVIFAGGINDAKRLLPSNELYVSLEQTQANVDNFIVDAKAVADEVLVVGSVRVDESLTTNYNGDAFYNEDIETYDQAIRECAEKQDVIFLPLADAIKHEHLADGLHPNAAGHQLIYERVKAALEAEDIL